MDDAIKRFIASGIVGYAVSMELITTLNAAGIIPDDRLIEVIDRALAAIEAVDSDNQHEISRLARDLLGSHLTDFRKQMDAR
jgi:hypothetical protein